MGKMINFNGSDLEKRIIDSGICNGVSLINKTPSAIIRSVLLVITHQIWVDKEKRPVVVIDEEGKAIAKFQVKGTDIFVGDFTLKAPDRLKNRPLYIFDLLEKNESKDIVLKFSNLNYYKEDAKFFMAVAVIFRMIREWMEENKDDTLSLFSVFETNGTKMTISSDILCTANRVCERDYLTCKLKDFNKRL